MADVFCDLDHGGGSGETGADWTNAWTTVALMVAGANAGDRVFIAGSESTPTYNLNFAGTPAAPIQLIGVHNKATPPVVADVAIPGADTLPKISATGSGDQIRGGSVFVRGVEFFSPLPPGEVLVSE